MDSGVAQTLVRQYTHTGDVVAMALCIAMGIMIYMSQLRKNVSVQIMYSVLGEIFISAGFKIIYEQEILSEHPWQMEVYILRELHYLLLAFVLLMYTLYLFEPLWIPHRRQRRCMIISSIFVGVSAVFDIVASVLGFGFHFNEEGAAVEGFDIYVLVYACLAAQIFSMIIRFKDRMISQVFWSLLGVNILSVALYSIQNTIDTRSYTTVIYFLPIIGILFMFHSNPFDVTTGAVSGVYFLKDLEEAVNKNRKTVIMTCSIRNFTEQIKTSKEFRSAYFTFLRTNVKKGVLYNLGEERLVLTLRKTNDAETKETIDKMLADFREAYRIFQLEYKIVILETSPNLLSVQDYLSILEFTENRMPINDVFRIGNLDISRFYDSRYILSQLEDIARKNDITDPRVLVYCQPVFNITTGRYDTAEALMRLSLEKTGMVYPDQFIPLAEQSNLIHALSVIILDKTCAAIRDFIEEGYEVQRISVNFSVADLRYAGFCKEIERIIDRNGIPYNKIAVEITETRCEADFNVLKEKVVELQKLGIKFYLDDFGTGYSNFERIMEIPFDIIKFDRSMLMELSRSDASRFMVNTFADMFNQLHYAVLFEGVENDDDEEKCVQMNAKFLQGYKYSRPIPIDQLRDFLTFADDPVYAT